MTSFCPGDLCLLAVPGGFFFWWHGVGHTRVGGATLGHADAESGLAGLAEPAVEEDDGVAAGLLLDELHVHPGRDALAGGEQLVEEGPESHQAHTSQGQRRRSRSQG